MSNENKLQTILLPRYTNDINNIYDSINNQIKKLQIGHANVPCSDIQKLKKLEHFIDTNFELNERSLILENRYFAGMTDLTNVNVSQTSRLLISLFMDDKNLKYMNQTNVSYVDSSSLRNCYKLTDFDIGNITRIDVDGMSKCTQFKLNDLTNVKIIDEYGACHFSVDNYLNLNNLTCVGSNAIILINKDIEYVNFPNLISCKHNRSAEMHFLFTRTDNYYSDYPRGTDLSKLKDISMSKLDNYGWALSNIFPFVINLNLGIKPNNITGLNLSSILTDNYTTTNINSDILTITGCTGRFPFIEKLELPNYDSLGEEHFKSVSMLKTLNLNLTSEDDDIVNITIPKSCFKDCSNLNVINFGSKSHDINNISECGFENCFNLSYFLTTALDNIQTLQSSALKNVPFQHLEMNNLKQITNDGLLYPTTLSDTDTVYYTFSTNDTVIDISNIECISMPSLNYGTVKFSTINESSFASSMITIPDSINFILSNTNNYSKLVGLKTFIVPPFTNIKLFSNQNLSIEKLHIQVNNQDTLYSNVLSQLRNCLEFLTIEGYTEVARGFNNGVLGYCTKLKDVYIFNPGFAKNDYGGNLNILNYQAFQMCESLTRFRYKSTDTENYKLDFINYGRSALIGCKYSNFELSVIDGLGERAMNNSFKIGITTEGGVTKTTTMTIEFDYGSGDIRNNSSFVDNTTKMTKYFPNLNGIGYRVFCEPKFLSTVTKVVFNKLQGAYAAVMDQFSKCEYLELPNGTDYNFIYDNTFTTDSILKNLMIGWTRLSDYAMESAYTTKYQSLSVVSLPKLKLNNPDISGLCMIFPFKHVKSVFLPNADKLTINYLMFCHHENMIDIKDMDKGKLNVVHFDNQVFYNCGSFKTTNINFEIITYLGRDVFPSIILTTNETNPTIFISLLSKSLRSIHSAAFQYYSQSFMKDITLINCTLHEGHMLHLPSKYEDVKIYYTDKYNSDIKMITVFDGLRPSIVLTLHLNIGEALYGNHYVDCLEYNSTGSTVTCANMTKYINLHPDFTFNSNVFKINTNSDVAIGFRANTTNLLNLSSYTNIKTLMCLYDFSNYDTSIKSNCCLLFSFPHIVYVHVPNQSIFIDADYPSNGPYNYRYGYLDPNYGTVKFYSLFSRDVGVETLSYTQTFITIDVTKFWNNYTNYSDIISRTNTTTYNALDIGKSVLNAVGITTASYMYELYNCLFAMYMHSDHSSEHYIVLKYTRHSKLTWEFYISTPTCFNTYLKELIGVPASGDIDAYGVLTCNYA